jgi:hypothetical protein
VRGRGPAGTLALAVLAACSPSTEDAAARAAAWLVGRQSADGAMRSDTYGVLRAGRATTALALAALTLAGEPVYARHRREIERAREWLFREVDADGALLGDGTAPDYPNYAAAAFLLALAMEDAPDWRDRSAPVVARLRRTQLGEARGVARERPAHGGFDLGLTTAPVPLDAAHPDLSVTAFVCEALRAAGVASGDPVLCDAKAFALRCGTADGGFTFFPHDAARGTKAGEGVPYGTATADGLRTLLACGAPADDVRVIAARRWLDAHAEFERVPGFDAAHANWEPGLRCYWLASAARAYAAHGHSMRQLAAIRAAASARLAEDGSHANPVPTMKEDDPLVATALLLIALAR